MTNQEIIQKLEICISIIKESENVYVRKQLEQVAEALIKQWNESDYYAEQIKQVLRYNETMENLNNIKL